MTSPFLHSAITSFTELPSNTRHLSVTTFLIKLHCKNDVGGADPRPTTPEQWEGARLRFKNPSRISGGRGDSVTDGDSLIVWTHEDPAFGGGQGLTAEGVAHDVREEPDNTLSATLENVRVFRPGFRLRGWRGGPTVSANFGAPFEAQRSEA